MERYYRPTVLPGRTTKPTTAPSRGFCGSRSGSSHGTPAGRYYRSTGRYYRSPGGTTALPGGTTALRYYRGALPSLLPPLAEVFAVVGAVVAMVLPPGGTTALPGGTTAQAKTARPKQA